jgi:MbtH protein
MEAEADDQVTYRVVVNHEQQYSIWPADRPPPTGWKDAGRTGAKSVCLEYVTEVWSDMRPLSLRRKLEAAATSSAKDVPPE